MVSLSIVILVLALSFTGLYFVLRMNKSDSLEIGQHSQRQQKVPKN